MTMKKLVCYKVFILLVIILVLVAGCEKIELSLDNPVDGWAVLAEKDEYEALYKPDMLVDYIDITRMRQALENSGWKSDHIHSLREFNRQTLQAELDWLEENADENDVVLMYITAHGYYLRDGLRWRDFFAGQWEQISSQRRVLVVDSSFASLFTNAMANDASSYITVAAVDKNEHSWKGIEEEGLPIIGGVFTYYFTAALDDPNTDTNDDGMISVQEAALMAEKQQRTYFHSVILVVTEFVDMFHAQALYPEQDPTYPHVIVDDSIGEPLFLTLNAYP
jgi:hypothetical protein